MSSLVMTLRLLLRRDTFALVPIVLMVTSAPATVHGADPSAVIPAPVVSPEPVPLAASTQPASDRIWSVSTRHLTYHVRRANLTNPALAISRLDSCGHPRRISPDEFYANVGKDRELVVYVHGNRLDHADALDRGRMIYNMTRRYGQRRPVDWVIWTWPADREGLVVDDARRKLARIDAQSMYLAWMLNKQVAESYRSTKLIGYSFGARIISGALHAMAGGRLGGRQFPAEPVIGIPYDVGFVAPATESSALSERGVHRLATKNMDRMVLLYNSHDAVLKRYWLLNRVRGTTALGYTGYLGPRMFAPRADHTRLPVTSRECSYGLGFRHEEVVYYRACNAGRDMAALINDSDDSE